MRETAARSGGVEKLVRVARRRAEGESSRSMVEKVVLVCVRWMLGCAFPVNVGSCTFCGPTLQLIALYCLLRCAAPSDSVFVVDFLDADCVLSISIAICRKSSALCASMCNV